MFDGFLEPNELENFIPSGKEITFSLPVLGAQKLHSISLFEGYVEQNPGKIL